MRNITLRLYMPYPQGITLIINPVPVYTKFTPYLKISIIYVRYSDLTLSISTVTRCELFLTSYLQCFNRSYLQ